MTCSEKHLQTSLEEIITIRKTIFDTKNTPDDFSAGDDAKYKLNDFIGSLNTLNNPQEARDTEYGKLVQICHGDKSNKLQHKTVKCTISRHTNKKLRN